MKQDKATEVAMRTNQIAYTHKVWGWHSAWSDLWTYLGSMIKRAGGK